MRLFHKEKQGNKRIIHFLGLKIKYKKKFDESKLIQDKNSQVEFYLIDSFEIYHYLPIYNELLKQGINAKIVAEPCEINTSGKWFDYNEAIRILEENNIDYCTKANPNAKIAITTQRADLLSKYRNKKINLSYGFGFTKNYFINSVDSTKGFDVKLAHGEIPKRIIQQYNLPAKIIKCGYPKYYSFLNNLPDRQKLLEELGIKTSKKILTYFPTWDEDSSIQDFFNAIKALKENYFIITKPHHCTYRLDEKKDDLNKLYDISDLVLGGNYNFTFAALLGDIALCDAKSGASCEVAYLNKNILVILLKNSKNNDKYLPEMFEYFPVVDNPDILSDVINSPDNKFRKEKLNEFLNNVFENMSVSDFVVELIKFL